MNKPKKKKVIKWSVLTGICAVLMVALMIATPLAMNYATVINIYLGTSSYEVVSSSDSDEDTTYYASSFESEDELVAYEEELCKQVEGEGAVLLKNDNDALPLDEGSSVSCFFRNSVDLVYGGTGSGEVSLESAPTLKSALEDSGFSVNETLWDFYSSDEIAEEYARVIPTDLYWDDYVNSTAAYLVNEVPWSEVEEAAGDSFASYGDAAIVVISRIGGEGGDLPSGDNGSDLDWIYSAEGDGNYLELTEEELGVLSALKELKDEGVFEKIIVLINSSNAIELDFLDPEICGVDYGVDAALWIGDVGNNGIEAVADILVGNINPSGSLVDTYCYDNLTSPAIVNFYSQLYTNWEEAGLSYGDYTGSWGLASNYNVTNSYSVYQEGIYVGYRYYETRYEDVVMGTENVGDYDYSSTVAYSFGYGLSYTTFEYSDFSVSETDDGFEVTVTVTNTGDVAGKNTVQVYFQSPYTDYDIENSIEKASIELCGYEKTDELEPGESQTVTIEVDKTELRTYDSYGAETYILDAGDYYFTIGNGAHEALNNVLAAKGYTTDDGMDEDGDASLVWTWTQDELDTEIFSTSEYTGVEITNMFDESDPNLSSTSPGEVTYLSRSDWEGTFPTTSQRNWEATDEMVEALEYRNYDPDTYDGVYADAEMPTMGADNGLTLASMIGKDYDDEDWDALLDQITFDEMNTLITLAGHTTAAVPSVAKPETQDENGPTGITATLMGGESSMCYTSEDIMAATFNDDLIYDVGRCIGEDALNVGYSGLYGPAANIHRTPYSGRNFEYYSEDPFISAEICSNEIQGIQSMGVYVYLKHFALNDSETYRLGICNWVNEQAAREIYLEAFEEPVAVGGAMGIMESLSRWGCYWAGENYNLITGVLRGEWGFEGATITDWSGDDPYEDVCDGLLAGTCLWDSTYEALHTAELAEYEDDPVIVTAMREATHRILYMVANSNAMNGLSANDTVKQVTPWWQAAIYALDVVVAVLLVLSVVMLVRTCRKKDEEFAVAEVSSQVEGDADKQDDGNKEKHQKK